MVFVLKETLKQTEFTQHFIYNECPSLNNLISK